MSKVYLAPATSSDSPESLARKVTALWQQAGLDECFQPTDLTAVKLHVGEPGCKTFVSPAIVAPLVRCIAAGGAQPFLTDTSVLYTGPRSHAIGHLQVARDHGFGPEAMGAPFIVADGLNGTDEVIVQVPDGKHFKEVAIASAIMHARSMLVVSHATGHLATGFGGTLKNLGMGCCSRKAKLQQHHGQSPQVDPDKCTGCASCASWCPSDAITVEDQAVIDEAECIGCGECIAVCRDDAVTFRWGISGPELQERIVEHAAAVVRRKPDRIAYVTVALGITKNCDCMGRAEKPLLDDIGILASRDPVAIDQAAVDLIRQKAGRTLESMSYPQADSSIQLAYADALGLGQRQVELVVS